MRIEKAEKSGLKMEEKTYGKTLENIFQIFSRAKSFINEKNSAQSETNISSL